VKYNFVRRRTLMQKNVYKTRNSQNYTYPGEIKINNRPEQTRESATKRAEPCSIEIFQHPVREHLCQNKRFSKRSRTLDAYLPSRRLGEHRRWSQNGHKTVATLQS